MFHMKPAAMPYMDIMTEDYSEKHLKNVRASVVLIRIVDLLIVSEDDRAILLYEIIDFFL